VGGAINRYTQHVNPSSLMMRRDMPSERVQRRIEERLDRADAAIDSDDWLVVRELAQDVLDLDPENVDAAGWRWRSGGMCVSARRAHAAGRRIRGALTVQRGTWLPVLDSIQVGF
jgi:hypothetical protein